MAFRIPTRVEIGPGSLPRLQQVVGHYDAGLALVVTDEGVSHAGIVRRVCGHLESAGFRVLIHADVVPNPRVQDVDAAAEEARKARAEVVVGVGGGSVIDAAKGIALMLRNPGSIRDYEGKSRFRSDAAPLIAIPTTCGTGSEVTWVSVLSLQAERRKISVKGDGLFPAHAIVDANLIATLPPHLVATTGMDALTHAVEAFVGKPANPVSDQLAASAIRLLLRYLERAVADVENDAEAREGVMHASTLAGMAFGNADVGAVHCLSEAVGGRHDLPHGLLNACLLAPMLEYQEEAIHLRLSLLAGEIGADSLLAAVRRLARSLRIPAFRELGVPKSDFLEIAKASAANGSNPSSRRAMEASDYLSVLRGLG